MTATKANKKTSPKKTASSSSNPMWGGHYSAAPAEIMEQINASIHFDRKLYAQDIQGSKAHVEMLAKQKILTSKEAKQIREGLAQIEKEIIQGIFVFTPKLEDIHMHVEARLKEIIGDVAGKLHTARSRNDQVATDCKLYVRDAIDRTDQQLKALQKSLIDRALEHAEALMPGFTHLQTAQPVTIGHHLLAYVEMFGRDRSRFSDARTRLNECPLGAAALAGTSFPIDRFHTAKALGFDRPTENSMDSVSDRDFVIEYMSAAALTLTHLSRFAEEIILWMSADFSFVKLSERFTTGSSIMPQKRNPDAAELVRAKTGRVYGNLLGLLTVMKGLPLSYSKDMQEDKEPLFDTVETLTLSLNAMTGMVQDLQFNTEKLSLAAERGYSTATDIADWLVQNLQIPFRQAHHITGRIVRLAEQKHCTLAELSLAELQTIEPKITPDALKVTKPKFSAASRTSYGGTAPKNVRAAANRALKRFKL